MAVGAIVAGRRQREKQLKESRSSRIGSISLGQETKLRASWSSPHFQDAVQKSTSAAQESSPEEQATLRISMCASGGEGSESLNLAMLGLEKVPASITDLSGLQHLDLTGNVFPTLPGPLSSLTALLTLSVEAVSLQKLDGELLRELNKLESLNLRNNDLCELPDSLFGLVLLKSLDLGGNQLLVLPPEIEQLRALEDLRLDHNQLQGPLPTALYSLTQLHNLCVQNNQFTQIPPGIAALRVLNNIELAGNEFTELPSEIAQMTELLHIDVANNPIRVPPQEICEQSALAIRGFLQDLECGSELCTSLDIFFLGAKDDSMLQLLSNDEKVAAPAAAAAAAATSSEAILLGGQRVGNKVGRSTWKLGPVTLSDGSHLESGVQARTWCFPSDEPMLHATHQILFHRRCLFVVTFDLSLYSDAAHDQMVQRWVRSLKTRVPGAVILFVATQHSDDENISAVEEQRICSSIAARVMQAEREHQEALQRHLNELRSVIDTREKARKSNPGQSTRQRGWRAMKSLVGSAAKRNEELCTRIAQQLDTVPILLRDGRPVCVDMRTGKGANDLRNAVIACLSLFPHVGSPLPARYVQLQQLFERQQIDATTQDAVVDTASISSKLAIYWNDFKVLAGRVGISGPDPVRRAARYLTLMGAILHVPDDAALKPFVFVDPPRLCEVFAAVLQVAEATPQAEARDNSGETAAFQEGLRKLRSSGALNPTLRRWLGSKLSLDEHTSQLVFAMMSRVGLHAERPAESEDTASQASAGLLSALTALAATDVMVPSLLPERPSPSLRALWGGAWASSWPVDPHRPQLNLQLRRVYILQDSSAVKDVGLPLGLFGCVLSRLMQRVAAEPVEMWSDGACMAVCNELGIPGARVLAERSVKGGAEVDGVQQSVLSLTVRTSTKMLVDGFVAALWGRLDDCVRSALEQHPGCVLSAYVACPLCQAKNLEPFLFTTTEVIEAWRDGAMSLLSPGLSRVPMELLHPPTNAEAKDADKQNSCTDAAKQKANRGFRQSQMDGLLQSFLVEGPAIQNALLGVQNPGNEPMMSSQQMLQLATARDEKARYVSTRMDFYRKDCKEMILSGDGQALSDIQTLIPTMLRCDSSPWL